MALLPLQPHERALERRQLHLEKLVQEHHHERALEYFNQFRFVPSRITMICSILRDPLGPLTTAMLDEGRGLVSRSRYIAILTQPNILGDKIAMYVQQMLLRCLITQADQDDIAEVSRWALLLDNNFFNILRAAGMVVTSGMRDFVDDMLPVPQRHKTTFADPGLQITKFPKKDTTQITVDFSKAIPPISDEKVVIDFRTMTYVAGGMHGYIFRVAVTTSDTTYDLAIKISSTVPESQDLLRKEVKNIKLLHGCKVPNVVPFIDAIFDENAIMKGCSPELPKMMLVMPYCGDSLKTLSNHSYPSLANMRHLTFNLLRTLQGLEENGFIHNDFCPKNISIVSNASWTPVVLDWATMQLTPATIDPKLPKTTYPWRSPENWLFQRTIDVSSDVWALGSILISSQTNKPMPFYLARTEPPAEAMIRLIAEEIGLPPKEFVESASNKEIYKPKDTYLYNVGFLQDTAEQGIMLFSKADTATARHYRDLISSCLMWDPTRRLKPSVLLTHPFFGGTAAANTTATSKK